MVVNQGREMLLNSTAGVRGTVLHTVRRKPAQQRTANRRHQQDQRKRHLRCKDGDKA